MTFIIVWIASCVLGGMIGSSKGKGGTGFVLGLLLGPIGVIITLFLKENTEKVEAEAVASGDSKKCPFCAELIKAEAKVCKHCGKDQPEPARQKSLDTVATPDTWLCEKCSFRNEQKFNTCQHCGAGR